MCDCQGTDNEKAGSTYTLGCSRSRYQNHCKFSARGGKNLPKKWKLKEDAPVAYSSTMKTIVEFLASTADSPFKLIIPQAYNKLVSFQPTMLLKSNSSNLIKLLNI